MIEKAWVLVPAAMDGFVAGAAGGVYRALYLKDKGWAFIASVVSGALCGNYAWPMTNFVFSFLWQFVAVEPGAQITFAQFTAGTLGGILAGIMFDMTNTRFEQQKKRKPLLPESRTQEPLDT